MANSELAESICTAYFNNTEGALLRNVIDTELQEIRFVLTGLQTSVIDIGDSVENHWCDPELNCNNVCERARALWVKLEVK